jgi:hypothetical protein
LRGLQFQTPHGSFGKGDNELKRASALLEYIAREEEGLSIPLTQLAKAAFVKEADFVKFHRQVGHFRQTPSSRNNSSTNAGDARSASANTNPLLSTTSNTSSIPSLAMKLGSYVNDSNGVAIRAQRLWNQLIRSSHKNPHQLQDMARFAKVYEAVCFFIQATRDARIEEEDDGKRLQPRTVVEVSTEFTLSDFTDILGHVQSLLDPTEAGKGASSSTGKTKGSTKKRTLSSADVPEEKWHATGSSSDPIEQTQHGKRTGVETVLERANTLEILEDDPFGYILTEPSDTSFSPRFLQWKQQTLDRAIRSAREACQEDHSGETVTRTQLLEIAAKNVLESCGLLLLKN